MLESKSMTASIANITAEKDEIKVQQNKKKEDEALEKKRKKEEVQKNRLQKRISLTPEFRAICEKGEFQSITQLTNSKLKDLLALFVEKPISGLGSMNKATLVEVAMNHWDEICQCLGLEMDPVRTEFVFVGDNEMPVEVVGL